LNITKETSSKTEARGAQTDMRRSCSEMKSANPGLNSGLYWIDPDGQDVGDDPIEVHCDMISGIHQCTITPQIVQKIKI
jgi:hypothetical protein